MTGYNLYFYQKYCIKCEKDKNKEADPICLHLIQMMEGIEIKKCSDYKEDKTYVHT